jgi:beta-galactosidase/evolved beta-galactosidase subunit alpha
MVLRQETPVPSQGAPAEVSRQDGAVVVKGPQFIAYFCEATGALVSWRVNEHELLVESPKLELWRAPTDNDMGWTNLDKKWREQGFDKLTHRLDSIEVEGHDIVIKTRFAPPVHSWGFHCTYRYRWSEDGSVQLSVAAIPDADVPEILPRVGLTMRLPADLKTAKWYGLGPGEAYNDTHSAQRLGVWTLPVDDLRTNYIRPQESGNRMDVRWLEIADANGQGIRIDGEPTFMFSAERYTIDDVYRAKHTYDLKPRDFVTLRIDYRHQGIGSNSCGPGPLPQYELHPETFEFAIQMRPL